MKRIRQCQPMAACHRESWRNDYGNVANGVCGINAISCQYQWPVGGWL
jgi:hypothetical protein